LKKNTTPKKDATLFESQVAALAVDILELIKKDFTTNMIPLAAIELVRFELFATVLQARKLSEENKLLNLSKKIKK
jgi:hypothetical protein